MTKRAIRRSSSPTAHRSEEHTSELQSLTNLVCRLLLEKKKKVIKVELEGRLFRTLAVMWVVGQYVSWLVSFMVLCLACESRRTVYITIRLWWCSSICLT